MLGALVSLERLKDICGRKVHNLASKFPYTFPKKTLLQIYVPQGQVFCLLNLGLIESDKTVFDMKI